MITRAGENIMDKIFNYIHLSCVYNSDSIYTIAFSFHFFLKIAFHCSVSNYSWKIIFEIQVLQLLKIWDRKNVGNFQHNTNIDLKKL